MIALDKLTKCQQKNKSLICLGLDLDISRIPAEFAKSTKGMYDFAHRIIEATSDFVCAYKPNIAFYENLGPEGISLLKQLIDHIPDDIPIIIDGKRGDIGNTASQYAEALFEKLGADWVTINPYMGYDSIRPFLEYKDKGVFILCLTSNSGSKDFQMLNVDGKPLYAVVAEKVTFWDKEAKCGLVVGATQPEQLREIRQIAKGLPLLIPGVGAQGGSLELAVQYGTDNFTQPAVINVSRSVLYASNQDDFAAKARGELRKLNAAVNAVRSGEQSTPMAPAPSPSPVVVQAPPPSPVVVQAPPPASEEPEPIDQVEEIEQIEIARTPASQIDHRDHEPHVPHQPKEIQPEPKRENKVEEIKHMAIEPTPVHETDHIDQREKNVEQPQQRRSEDSAQPEQKAEQRKEEPRRDQNHERRSRRHDRRKWPRSHGRGDRRRPPNNNQQNNNGPKRPSGEGQ